MVWLKLLWRHKCRFNGIGSKYTQPLSHSLLNVTHRETFIIKKRRLFSSAVTATDDWVIEFLVEVLIHINP